MRNIQGKVHNLRYKQSVRYVIYLSTFYDETELHTAESVTTLSSQEIPRLL
jgi:hypothetical protein